MLLFTGGLLLTSCETEPADPNLLTNTGGSNGGNNGGNNGGGTPANIAGTYKMTAFNTSVPTDLNGDGTPSTNQMNETSCFNNTMLVLSANNTFTSTGSSLEIVTDGTNTTLECTEDPSYGGTWTLSGNILKLTYTEDGETYTDQYTVSGNTLKISLAEGLIVGSGSGGEPAYLTANIDIIFTKQ
ncbi:lipocalin family protein [Flavobacterium cerinum]|uniref:Lipocalin family protein n=1 Tax=Flavobacterium cerinum TaxID=2502784 RepID=A0ABY5IRG0_9FLAO|nr:lipocalin family protein [Flavobacterium cerinum]UUC44870.1 lipocalin family protein [Flavobacterium cerinum]